MMLLRKNTYLTLKSTDTYNSLFTKQLRFYAKKKESFYEQYPLHLKLNMFKKDMIKFTVQKLNFDMPKYVFRDINENDLSAFYFYMKKQNQNKNPL